jgi:hypothetical protein
MSAYVGYFKHWRPRRSLGQRAPCDSSALRARRHAGGSLRSPSSARYTTFTSRQHEGRHFLRPTTSYAQPRLFALAFYVTRVALPTGFLFARLGLGRKRSPVPRQDSGQDGGDPDKVAASHGERDGEQGGGHCGELGHQLALNVGQAGRVTG